MITPDGKECFSYSRDNVVSRWDLQNGQLLSSQKLPWNGDLRSSCFSADGQRLAVSYHQRDPNTGKVLIFRLHPFGLLLKREVHSSLIDNVRLTSDGAYAFVRRSYLNSEQNKENVLEVMEVESGRVVSVSSESMIPGWLQISVTKR